MVLRKKGKSIGLNELSASITVLSRRTGRRPKHVTNSQHCAFSEMKYTVAKTDERLAFQKSARKAGVGQSGLF